MGMQEDCQPTLSPSARPRTPRRPTLRAMPFSFLEEFQATSGTTFSCCRPARRRRSVYVAPFILQPPSSWVGFGEGGITRFKFHHTHSIYNSCPHPLLLTDEFYIQVPPHPLNHTHSIFGPLNSPHQAHYSCPHPLLLIQVPLHLWTSKILAPHLNGHKSHPTAFLCTLHIKGNKPHPPPSFYTYYRQSGYSTSSPVTRQD